MLPWREGLSAVVMAEMSHSNVCADLKKPATERDAESAFSIQHCWGGQLLFLKEIFIVVKIIYYKTHCFS